MARLSSRNQSTIQSYLEIFPDYMSKLIISYYRHIELNVHIYCDGCLQIITITLHEVEVGT